MCPTYRVEDSQFNLRLFGVVSLIKQMKNQSFDGDIKICVVDTSSKPHPFFKYFDNDLSNDILYFHIPERNNIDKKIKDNFPYATSFIPTDDDKKTDRWKRIIDINIAWDKFIPWDRNYPTKSTMEQQISWPRPTIGMGRNFSIASLFEKFGDADYIAYADDDDFRSNDYIKDIIDNIGDNDFVRMMKFYTYHMPKDLWGLYDVNLKKDINGNWLPAKETEETVLYNGNEGTNYKEYHLYERFTPLLSLAFPHLSCDGALQAFKFNLWQNMLDEFGGIPITSICEDVVFYRNCKDYFGHNFKSDEIKVKGNPSFLKVADGENATVLEWNYPLKENEVDDWATEYIKLYRKINLENKNNLENYYEKLGKKFLDNGEIIWN